MQRAGECRLNMFRQLPLQGLTSGQLGVLIGYFTQMGHHGSKSLSQLYLQGGVGVLPLPRSTDETT